AGDPDRVDESFALDRQQGVDRAAGGGRIPDGDVHLRIVQMKKGNPVQTQPLETLLERAPHPIAAEIPRCRVSIYLGGEDEARWKTATLRDRLADASFAVAAGIVVGRVEEIDGSV